MFTGLEVLPFCIELTLPKVMKKTAKGWVPESKTGTEPLKLLSGATANISSFPLTAILL